MLTRFMAWFVRSELPVYRDIVGNERGSTFPEIARALEGNVTRMLLISRNSEQIVAVASPILQLGRVEGAVLLSSRPGEIDELIWRQRRALMVLLSLALLATLLASWLLSRTIAGPMRRLSEAADHVSQSINARQELPDFPGRRDEVGHMAEAFRDMTAALFRRIEASDKFAQDVTHELKNPVAAARARAETLGYAKTDEQRAEMVGEIQHELKRLNRLITDVANASRLDAELALQETEPIDIGRIAAAIVGVFNDLHAASGRKVLIRTSSTGDTRDPFMVIGHEGRISQVFTNLIDNALSFSPEGGAVRVTLRREGRDVLATVDDDGPGIPPDKLEDVFKRFYSDRPQTDGTQGKNSGLGLSISREIVFAHGGRLTAENRPAVPGEVASVREQPDLKARRVPGVAGARFVMRLPAGDATGGRR
jgi:two-component system sensor histidine kinase ChvG